MITHYQETVRSQRRWPTNTPGKTSHPSCSHVFSRYRRNRITGLKKTMQPGTVGRPVWTSVSPHRVRKWTSADQWLGWVKGRALSFYHGTFVLLWAMEGTNTKVIEIELPSMGCSALVLSGFKEKWYFWHTWDCRIGFISTRAVVCVNCTSSALNAEHFKGWFLKCFRWW